MRERAAFWVQVLFLILHLFLSEGMATCAERMEATRGSRPELE